MTRGTYIGSNDNLKGKIALVFVAGERYQREVVPSGKIMIQADDKSTGFGLGWHEFPSEDWEVEYGE